MNLQELFQEHLKQEFPPKVVFVYNNSEIKSLAVNKLPEYEAQYKFTGFYSEESTYSYSKHTLPVLVSK